MITLILAVVLYLAIAIYVGTIATSKDSFGVEQKVGFYGLLWPILCPLILIGFILGKLIFPKRP